MKDIQAIIKAKDWQHYLTRPFSILGASLWQAWYDSEEAEKVLGYRSSDFLFLEEKKNVMRCYRPDEQIQNVNINAKKKITNVNVIKPLLNKAESLNKQAINILNGKEDLESFKHAVKFLITLSLHGTVLPFRAGSFLNEIKDKETIKRIEKLRGISYYPRILEEIIMPLATEELKKAGIKDYKKVIEYLTYSEIVNKEFNNYKNRMIEDKSVILAMIDKEEYIFMTKDIESLINKIEGNIEKENIEGNCAYPGKVKGIVRIVNDRTAENVEFTEGDILVSISTSPIYMKLMQKAGAIVSDEGGLLCHAAIISRELKKPCIIGTKIATKVLKDGDLVEVDANSGIVKKIK
ncbi:hypothetical protein COV16_03470 [Candidatus Woesearchaeota archaeon CG10_big_fil_rev_8_21_14_0_10_34_8]|nr:MAG: hypothetical protein COV16_03470 [Candidatus Woesearchaeota archaeon CG10_big_fil_rev_8_21_14_0_10_34_8]